MDERPMGPRFVFKDFLLDVGARSLRCDGRDMLLKPKEFEILLILIEARGQVVSKEKIMDEVWPDTSVEEGSIAKNVSLLRKSLGSGAIKTVTGVGYRFDWAVQEESPIKPSAERISVRDAGGEAASPSEEAYGVKKLASFWQMGRVLTVAAVIVGSIVAGVLVYLHRRGATRRDEASRNPAAYVAFLRGCLELEKKNAPAFQLALGNFRVAVADDPEYAEAYAKISETYINLASNISNGPAYANAKLAAQTALQLDPNLAEAHRDLGWLKLNDDSDPKGAEVEYLKSLRMNDKDGRAHHWYAQLLLAERRPDEAIREAKRGLELDRLGLGSNYNYAFILNRAGQPREGIHRLEDLLQREPENEVVLGYLGLAYEELNQYGKAADFLRRAANASQLKYQYEASMVYPLAKNGDSSEAQRIAQELITKKNNGEWIPGYNLAVMYVGLKQFDRAFFWLGQCHVDRSCSLVEMETNPIRQELSSDPRFDPLERLFGGGFLEADWKAQ